MQHVEGIIQLYELGPYPAREPTIHVVLPAHVLRRVPFVPFYPRGNQFPIGLHELMIFKGITIANGRTNRSPGSGDGSRLYKVNK